MRGSHYKEKGREGERGEREREALSYELLKRKKDR
jgi:hypothetical protein